MFYWLERLERIVWRITSRRFSWDGVKEVCLLDYWMWNKWPDWLVNNVWPRWSATALIYSEHRITSDHPIQDIKKQTETPIWRDVAKDALILIAGCIEIKIDYCTNSAQSWQMWCKSEMSCGQASPAHLSFHENISEKLFFSQVLIQRIGAISSRIPILDQQFV